MKAWMSEERQRTEAPIFTGGGNPNGGVLRPYCQFQTDASLTLRIAATSAAAKSSKTCILINFES
ncbi:MAG: hypothetical protein RJA34_1480 [Pseudomonadota bacterium]